MMGTSGDCDFIVGSDVDRDGLCLEVRGPDPGGRELIEIFYCDQTRRMTVTLFEASIPLELIERAICVARERLPLPGEKEPSAPIAD